MSDHKPLLHQRMWAALKSRDWFGVSIEVFAVVLGVLLGLQASQWADERKEAKERAALVERLVGDLTIYAEESLNIAETRQERLDAVIGLAKAVDEGRVETLDRETMLEALEAVGSFDDVRPLPLTFVELVENGSLARISDDGVRKNLETLSRFHARYGVAATYLNELGMDRWSAITSWTRVPASAYQGKDLSPVDTSETVITIPDLGERANRDILTAAMQRDFVLVRYDRSLAKIASAIVEEIQENEGEALP